MTKLDRLKQNYELACDAYITAFVYKHGYEFTGWVADQVGGIAEFIEQYFFNMEDIRYDIDNKLPKDKIFEWQDYGIEQQLSNKTAVNLKNFHLYGHIELCN